MKNQGKKTSLVYTHYLNTGRIYTMWEGHFHDTTDGSPPSSPMTQDQALALSATRPDGQPNLMPWMDEYKDRMLREKSAAAHVRFVDMGGAAFFGIPEAAKEVTRKINAKTAKSKKSFSSFKGLKQPNPNVTENDITKRITGERDWS